jgi:hypothetical protein
MPAARARRVVTSLTKTFLGEYAASRFSGDVG